MLLLLKIGLTGILVGVLLYLWVNKHLHCPKCRRIFAAKISKKKKVKEKKSEEIVWNARKGEDEKKEIRIKTMNYEYTCKYCGKKWKHKKQEY